MRENDKSITVIIPVYKTENYITNTIISLANQTYQDFEVILINDETPDSAIQQAEALLIKNNIKYLTFHQKNQGLGVSRNNGVRHVKTEWFMFLDSDDILQPDTFKLMKDAIDQDESIEFVFTDFQKVYPGNEFKNSCKNFGYIYFDRSEIQNEFLLRNQIILAPGTLFRTNWYRNIAIEFKPIPFSEDQLFVWNLLLYTNKAVKIRKVLYNYLQRPGSIMTSSKLNAIINGYQEYKKLQELVKSNENSTVLTKRFLLSRWVIGIIHSGAKLLNKSDFLILLSKLDAKKNLSELLYFPSYKIIMVSYLILHFPTISYFILKKL